MNNQEIIDNAPEGAEFTSSMGYLWNDNEDWFIYGATTEEWNHLFFHEYSFSDWKIRSLADIKRIVELEANQERAEKLIFELHEQVYDSKYLDGQVELYETLKGSK
jgi:hypothetical protein